MTAESVITQLVFEHSLRIRMRGETFEAIKKQPQALNQQPKSDASSIASTAASSGSQPSSSQSTLVDHSNGQDPATKEDITTDQDVDTEEEEAELLLEEVEENAHASSEKPKTSQLIGKINSLVTTDLRDVMYLQNMLNLRKYYPHVIVMIFP